MYTSTDLLTVCLVLLGVAGFVAYQAHVRGKNPWLWFAIGIAFGLLSPILLLFFTTGNQTKNDKQPEEKKSVLPPEPTATPTMAHEDDAVWFYLNKQREPLGPVSLVALRELLDRGELNETDFVWTKGMNDWKKIQEIPEILPT